MRYDRHYRHAMAISALVLALAGCASESATGPGIDARRGGNGSPPSKLLLVTTQPGDYPSPMLIGGPSFTVDFNVQNPHRATEEIWVEVRVEQGASFEVHRVLDVFDVDCASGPGILLRNDACTMTRAITVSNAAPGTGTLVPGFARFRHRWYRGHAAPELLGDLAHGVTLAANP